METIENLKEGTCFKFPGKKTVYVRGKYNRQIRKYEFCKYYDTSAINAKKKGTIVQTDFDF